VRWIKYGGEPLPPKYLRQLKQHMPNATISNVYGPAEVNQCTFYHVPDDYNDQNFDQPIPIGEVWADSKRLIVDDTGNPVADGEIGELAICSPTRMVGYWGRREQTEKSMLTVLSSPGKYETFYKTGDMVQKIGGLLHFVGRKDRQVKVRGYRVELDEIESAINNLESIEEAGVYWVEDEHAKQIHAAAILRDGASADPDWIKNWLGDYLSWYSIPSEIFLVNELPRTTSGKIDRKQLKIEAEEKYANGVR
jgi:acyl-coenzyme A synthetase/AMP-(fatty) acid ligase